MEQIIYNLIINSIDAHRSRKNMKRNLIKVYLKQESEFCIIRYLDFALANL